MGGERRQCLVVGGSGALGGAVAVELARRGVHVGVHYHSDRESAEQVADCCRRAGGEALVVGGSVHDRLSADALFDLYSCAAGHAPTEMVIASGIVHDEPFLRTSSANWDQTLRVNLNGPAWLLRAACEAWSGTGGGHAVVVGSHAGLAGRTGGAAYAASKAALVGLVRSVARECGANGVRVNIVVPPFVEAGMGEGAAPGVIDAVRAASVTGGIGSLDRCAVFVADVLALREVSGQILAADTRISVW